MKNEVVQLTIAAMALVAGGAAEELLPKAAGVGFPVLLMYSIFLATRRNTRSLFMFAVAAGAAEDALSGLPFATSIAFFAMAAAFVHTTGLVRSALALAYPVYQIWLRMWCADLHGGVFGRFLAAFPAGVATAAAVWWIADWIERKGAVDEA